MSGLPQVLLGPSVQEVGEALRKGCKPYPGRSVQVRVQRREDIGMGAFGCSQRPLTVVVRLMAQDHRDLGLCHSCSSLGPGASWDDAVGCRVSEGPLRCNLTVSGKMEPQVTKGVHLCVCRAALPGSVSGLDSPLSVLLPSGGSWAPHSPGLQGLHSKTLAGSRPQVSS